MKALRCLVLAVLPVAFSGCARREQPAVVDLPALAVQTAVVQREMQALLIETSGTVRAVQRATIAAKIAGSVANLPVMLGQNVAAGELLLTISAAELTARVAQSRAQLTQVERELARERTLQSSGAGTVESVKALEDRIVQAQAALREAETMVAYAEVRAPFAGVVAKKYVEAGDFAAPGAPLLQLDGLAAFEIEIGVPESLAAPLAVGTVLEAEVAVAPARFHTTISELSSAADSAARTITAKLKVPAGLPVRPGQFVRVFLPGASTTALWVPANAVSHFGQMERVFVVSQKNRASLRLVKTGAASGDRIEVVAGVDAGERIVLAPPPALRDGQRLILSP